MTRPSTSWCAPSSRPRRRCIGRRCGCRLRAHEGGPLWTVWTLVARPDVQITVQSPEPLVAAQHRALDEAFARAQLGRLGGTAYDLVDLDLDVQGSPFAPASLLNTLRRDAVAQLAAIQSQPPQLVIADPDATLADLLSTHHEPKLKIENRKSKIHLLVRTPGQLDAALALDPPGQHHVGLFGPVWVAARGGAGAGRRDRGAGGQPPHPQTGGAAGGELFVALGLPDFGALGGVVAGVEGGRHAYGLAALDRRLQPQRRQPDQRGDLPGPGAGPADPHPRSQRRPGGRVGPELGRRPA